ncbi:hypothetical protein [Streptomyces sp. NPDC051776]|uniref:hypothetical protein n=1 Tax=Streptomyces sp. NPDC051776 TaxID=3155414 RepID=UPI003433B2E6
MRAHKIATATMLVLAISGWGVVGSGAAYADNGPTHEGKPKAADNAYGKAKAADRGRPAHGRVKARAEGGSATGAGLFQQNIAQSSRQNNNCNNPNPEEEGEVSLTNSRVRGRCVTADGSLNAFSRIQNGPAIAQGGSAATTVVQQTIAQRGRQNNNCQNPNNASITLDDGRVEGLCTDQDHSFNKQTLVKNGGAHAKGGDSGTENTLEQQNIAQVGRQNNNCNNPNDDSDITLMGGGRVDGRCKNKDGSFNHKTLTKGRGARAHGGSATGDAADVNSQNIAQEGRQNNNCNNPNNESDITLDSGGRVAGRCGNKDHSLNHKTLTKGGGARSRGGNAVVEVNQQNTAQEGRQNNNCNNQNNDSDIDLDDGGGRVKGRCKNKDHSFNHKSLFKGRGAHAEGGSQTSDEAVDLDHQNIAQEGRQNNNCNNPNDGSDITLMGGGRVDGRCKNKDGSFNHKTVIKGGGARAKGGNGTVEVDGDNIAQEGRQNNNCQNAHDSNIDLDEGRVESRCGNKDHSFSKHTHVKGGGARAEGGNATADVSQQNIAQEGRQNNNCNNQNEDSDINPGEGEGGRVDGRCWNKDASFSKHTHIKGGGARVEGGNGTGEGVEVDQQNVAQEGRQNNNCNNPNEQGDIEVVDGGRLASRCWNKDASFSKHTHIKGGGARVEGGNATVDMAQMNTAQEGRQNNNCNHLNDFDEETIDVSEGGRLAGHCENKDHSFNHRTSVKGGGARTHGGNTTGTAIDFSQQNTAQEGRQNNTCNNPNQNADIDVTDGQAEMRCRNKDASFNHKATVKGGGASAEGGNATADLIQQNIAQEGRQNNTCANINGAPEEVALVVDGGQAKIHCQNKDASFNHKAFLKGGGARAEGGNTTGGDAFQQNIAQEGRQNLACGNLNHSEVTLTQGDRYKVNCKQVDHSTNIHTKDVGGGAKATGGGATADLFQQNIAQEGRQNTACGNTNNLTLTLTGGSRSTTPCTSADHSTNIATEYR